MADSIEGLRQEIAATRARLDDTVAALGDKVTAPVDAVKSKLDVFGMAREHPWLVLGAALAAGLAIGASGADRKAAKATVRGAKAAGGATASGAKKAAAAVKEKLSGNGDHHADDMGMAALPGAATWSRTSGVLDGVRAHFDKRAAEMALLLWDGAREMNLPRTEGRQNSGGEARPDGSAASADDVPRFDTRGNGVV